LYLNNMVAITLFALAALIPALAHAGPINKRYVGQKIKSFRTGTCLSLPYNVAPTNGVELVVTDCDSATPWDINPGSGSITISGDSFALDAGIDPHNNVQAKIWESYPGITQQTWYLTEDNRIAITGGTQCLDEGDNGPQTYTCTPGNTNQIWYVVGPGAPMSSTTQSVVVPTTTITTTSTAPSAPVTTLRTSRQLRINSAYRCLTVMAGENEGNYNGKIVGMDTCGFVDDAYFQVWNFLPNGLIQWAHDTRWCLDAGTNPSNGVQLKLWQCYPGLAQQTWNIGDGAGLYSTANNECLDVRAEDPNVLQTWQCSSSDPQQNFYITG